MAEILNDMVEEEGTSVDELEEQVEQVTEEVAAQEDDGVLERFKGKTPKEISESYANLEKEYSRRSQEIGELRKLTDQILQQQIVSSTRKEPEKQEEAVDYFVDPEAAVKRAIDNHPKLKEFEQQTIEAKKQAALQKFTSKHGDYQDILQEGDFQSWVTASPVRQRLFAQANQQYDFEAADEIFSQYKERKQYMQGVKQQTDDNRKAALKASEVPKGNSSAEVSKKVYRRSDLIRLKMTDPARYEALSDEIMAAYAEGRVK